MTTPIEFQPWPKIARLNRDIVITEKLDGTNAAIVIVPLEEAGVHFVETDRDDESASFQLVWDDPDRENPVDPPWISISDGHVVFAQSRTRFITPASDNYGFAGWVQRNAEALVVVLGVGTHFGEWWGAGVQRKYGLTGADKRFSLFNASRYSADDLGAIDGLGVVPVLYRGPFDQSEISTQIERLRTLGSVAAPGFMKPEGVVVWHEAARQSFKVTLDGDEAPKSVAAHANDESSK